MPLRDKKHLEQIKGMNCWGCGRAPYGLFDVVPAHIRRGSDGAMGRKPSDNYAAPLCTSCHGLQHNKGEITFWRETALGSVESARLAALNLYETGNYSHAMTLEGAL